MTHERHHRDGTAMDSGAPQFDCAALERGALDSAAFELDGAQYHYVAIPRPAEPAEILTGAERDVAMRAIRGDTSNQIAHDRQTSERTVANQLGCIYRKLKVCNRADLLRAMLTA